MLKKSIIIIFVTIIMVTLLSFTTAYAQPKDEHRGKDFKEGDFGPHKGEDMMRKIFMDIVRELKLTDEQLEAINDVREDLELQNIKLFGNLKEVEILIKKEIKSDEPNTKKIKEYCEKMGTIHSQLLQNSINAVLKVKGILSAEQWKKALAYGWLEFMVKPPMPKP